MMLILVFMATKNAINKLLGWKTQLCKCWHEHYIASLCAIQSSLCHNQIWNSYLENWLKLNAVLFINKIVMQCEKESTSSKRTKPNPKPQIRIPKKSMPSAMWNNEVQKTISDIKGTARNTSWPAFKTIQIESIEAPLIHPFPKIIREGTYCILLRPMWPIKYNASTQTSIFLKCSIVFQNKTFPWRKSFLSWKWQHGLLTVNKIAGS